MSKTRKKRALNNILAKRGHLIEKKQSAANLHNLLSFGCSAFIGTRRRILFVDNGYRKEMLGYCENQLLIEFLANTSERLQREINEIDEKLSEGIEW